MENKQYVQYGCGLSAPHGWLNYDASPTLRLQRFPFIGPLLKRRLNVVFPSNVLYGDIVKGLPGIIRNSCDGVYCSHILEHLSLKDFRIAIRNTFNITKPGGRFRVVVPDLEHYISMYTVKKDSVSALEFMEGTLLGVKERKKGFSGVLEYLFGNSKHLWMWDYLSLKKELEDAGFHDIRACKPGDSNDPMFLQVENPGRFKNAVAIECFKNNT